MSTESMLLLVGAALVGGIVIGVCLSNREEPPSEPLWHKVVVGGVSGVCSGVAGVLSAKAMHMA